jgi:DNA-binding GntR family transcriptional regulator
MAAGRDPDKIDPESGETVYNQVARLVRARIEAGEITGRVPSAKSLAEHYDVSHGSAERGLRILRDDGLIKPSPGKGYYVVRRDQ